MIDKQNDKYTEGPIHSKINEQSERRTHFYLKQIGRAY